MNRSAQLWSAVRPALQPLYALKQQVQAVKQLEGEIVAHPGVLSSRPQAIAPFPPDRETLLERHHFHSPRTKATSTDGYCRPS